MRLGLVANEFFDVTLGRMGGFGFAAKQVIDLFAARPELGVHVHCLPGQRLAFADGRAVAIHGAPVTPWQGRGVRGALRLRRALALAAPRARPDALLTIDYRPSYDAILHAFPRTPVVVWVRDPRTPEDVARVRSLRLPDDPAADPRGIAPIDCTSLRRVHRWAALTGRPVEYGTVSMHLADKMRGTYGVDPGAVRLLPNIVPVPAAGPVKSARPSVLFLGRLDPIKRPWLFYALAERLPDVDFVVLGQAHGGWVPGAAPPNLRHLGHAEGAAKDRALASAWLLVNTSIHEAVAFSFLEALAHETPVVSCQAAGGLVARFGAYVGWAGGDGRALLPVFERAVTALLADNGRRERLGREGRAWVAAEHSADRFVATLREMLGRAGVRWP